MENCWTVHPFHTYHLSENVYRPKSAQFIFARKFFSSTYPGIALTASGPVQNQQPTDN